MGFYKKPPTPTIKRRKAWPKWARFYVVCDGNGGYVCRTKPRIFRNQGHMWSSWAGMGRNQHVRGPTFRGQHWHDSLRRIV